MQVRPHRVQRIEGHHRASQVQGLQELGEMAGLVVLHIDFEVIQQAPAMLGGAQEVHPGTVTAAGPARGLAVHSHGP